jgi:hypothetical protein
MVPLVLPARLVLPVPLAPLVQLALLVPLARPARLVLPVPLVQMALLVPLVRLVRLARLGPQQRLATSG